MDYRNKIAVTIQVTGDCNLACTYCYQHNKKHQVIDVNVAKTFIDKLISNDQDFFQGYIDTSDKAINLEFTGGEGFLYYPLVIELIDYFKESCRRHNRMKFYCFSSFNVGTNGTIFNDEIVDLLKRHPNKISVSLTVDGCKELHDSCRVFKNSNLPSYDIVVKNLEKFRQYTPINATKLTLAPENLSYLSSSMKNMFENLKYKEVHANCVFEDVWQDKKYPPMLYNEMIKVADYLLDNFDKENQPRVSLFNENFFKKERNFDSAWCGGNGKMIFLQYDGQIYNCTRYSITSVGEDKHLPIGNIKEGVCNHDLIAKMKKVTRGTMNPEKCKKCPIAAGCADCLAYCYEVNGDWKKLTSLCEMHKARSLGNVYFWNKYYMKYNIPKVFLMHLPKEEALQIISEEEYQYLLSISNERYIESLKQGGVSDEQIERICKEEFEEYN